MYQIKIYDGPEDLKGITIHSSLVNSLKLNSGIIKKEVSKIDSFVASYNLSNPSYGKIRPFRTLLSVLNKKTNKYEFEGRALTPTEDMKESGEFATSFIFEGELGYLHDAPQRHLEYRGSPYELLKTQLDYFNSQVEPYKRFEIGNVTVTDPNDYVYLYLSAEKSTYDSIQNTLIDRLGGELQIRKENGVRYLDYLVQVGHESSVEIKLARNLLSISKKVDPTEVVSRLTPLGNRIASEDEDATDASQARLTIESVNEGLPYIDRQDLIEEFGLQGASVVWDGITTTTNLMSSGRKWLDNQKTILYQYTVNAVDLFKIGLDIEEFEIGNTHPVKNKVMTIDERLRIIGKTIDINAPEKDSLSIGDKFKTANEYQSDLNKSNLKVINLENQLENQNKKIGSLKNELSGASESLGKIKLTLKTVNIDNLPVELQGINTSVNNLKTTIDKLVIPTYGPATVDNDGLMTSEDKIKLDDLKNYDVATVMNAGLMSIIDKQKLNRVKVNQSIDLDQLAIDFLALKELVESM